MTTTKRLARAITALWPELEVHVERGYSSTDRKIPGTRLIRAGKGRHGARLTVYEPCQDCVNRTCRRTWHPVVKMRGGRLVNFQALYEHNNAETYRNTDEIVEWIAKRLREGK